MNMVKSKLKIGIIGGGNVGRVLSVLLASEEYDVEMVCRNNHHAIKIDNSYAFEIKGEFGCKSFLIPFVTSIDKFSSKKDIIILATKSYDTVKRASQCTKYLNPNGMIVTIHNMYCLDKLYNLVPPENSVCMICDFAAVSYNKVTYVRNYKGVTLGVYHKKAINKLKLLEDILNDVMEVHLTNDFVGFALGRNIINGAICLLGGITGLPLKDILRNKNTRKLFYNIIDETYNVFRKMNINVLPYNNQLDYEEFLSHSLKSKFYRRRILKALIKQNGMIRSSAIEDLQKGNPTEIRCLLNCILEYGRKHNSETETLNYLDKVLTSIELGKLRIDKNLFNA